MCGQESADGFWSRFKKAFAIPRDKPLTDRQRQWLERIAQEAVRRGMTTPALLVLETVKPVNYVGAHVLLFFKPVMSAVIPPEDCDEAADLLEKRSALETLREMIEKLDAERRAKETGQDAK
jgi:hypothetical protein